jgi:thiosulfate dehydrogenase
MKNAVIRFGRSNRLLIWMVLLFIIIVNVVVILLIRESRRIYQPPVQGKGVVEQAYIWYAPRIDQLPASGEADLIRYGKDLIARTSYYLGPKGKVATITNGMNCQNCHLEAGTRLWGNNYSAVFSTYPRYRERSGTVENIYKRINDCIERSLNGKKIDTNSREMQAISTYINWLGHNVPKDVKPFGAGIRTISFLNRAADPARGRIVYEEKCQRCHGKNGEGVFIADGTMYEYPPLWGPDSYNTGAGLFRLGRFAGYVKDNMPFDKASHSSPHLTDEEAWDVAAFVNSQPRPQKEFSKDWPNIAGKPVDHPFGPFADGLSEQQHKYGPWENKK